MIKKLSFLLLSVFFLFIPYLISPLAFNEEALAAECTSFSITPNPLTKTTADITVSIPLGTRGNGDYRLEMQYGERNIENRINDADVHVQNLQPDPLVFTFTNIQQFLYKTQVIFSLKRDAGGHLETLCTKTVPIVNTETQNCKIVFDSFRDTKIRFHVEGLEDPPESEHGVVIQPLDNNGDPGGETNFCTTSSLLTTGGEMPKNNGNSWDLGAYQVKITEKCFFGHADGDPICDTPVKFNTETCPTPDNPNSCVEEGSNTTYTHKLDAPCKNPDGSNCSEINTAIGNVFTDAQGFVKWVLGFVLSLAGGILLLIIILSGYRLMTSQGDPEKVKEARERLTSAIIGLLFIIFSFVIFQFITADVLNLPGFGG